MASAVIAALAAAGAEYARSRQQQGQGGQRAGKLSNPRAATFGGQPISLITTSGGGPQARFASEEIRLPGTSSGQFDTTFLGTPGGPAVLQTHRTASQTPGTNAIQGRAATRTRGGLPVFTNGVTVRRRHRRMNITNVKALRRAERRVKGFVHLARKFVTFHTTHKLKHHRRRR